MNKAGKFLIGAVALGALGAVVFMRLNQEEEPLEMIPDPTVRTASPQPGTIELATELTGAIEPADVVYAVSQGSGEVLEVYVKQGDMVEKDQTLFRIDNKQLESARISLDSARVTLQDARTNLERMRVLYESGDISAQSYEQVANNVALAELQYDGAKLSYDIQTENSVVTAPIGGLLESFDVSVHDMMAAGNVAAVISGEGSRSVSFAVSERVARGIQVGDVLKVEKNGSEYEGIITEIGTMVNQATGLFDVKATLEGAEGLANGARVKLSVTDQKAEQVMTVPVDAVYYSSGDAYVYTYDAASGTAVRTPVEDGLIGSEIMEIKSGLDYDDQVIVSWSRELYDGAPVNLADTMTANQ